MEREQPLPHLSCFWTPERKEIYQKARRELAVKLQPYHEAVQKAKRLTADDLLRRVNY